MKGNCASFKSIICLLLAYQYAVQQVKEVTSQVVASWLALWERSTPIISSICTERDKVLEQFPIVKRRSRSPWLPFLRRKCRSPLPRLQTINAYLLHSSLADALEREIVTLILAFRKKSEKSWRILRMLPYYTGLRGIICSQANEGWQKLCTTLYSLDIIIDLHWL